MRQEVAEPQRSGEQVFHVREIRRPGQQLKKPSSWLPVTIRCS
jgi:hypothetical protein